MTTPMKWSSKADAYVGYSGASQVIVSAEAMQRAVTEFVRLTEVTGSNPILMREAQRRLLDAQNWLGGTRDGSGGVLIIPRREPHTDSNTGTTSFQAPEPELHTSMADAELSELDDMALDAAWQQLRVEDEDEWQRTRLARRAARLASATSSPVLVAAISSSLT